MLSGEGFLFLPSCKPHAETNSSYIYFQELQYSFLSFFFFPFGEVYICFIFITCLRYVPRPAAAHKPRTCCWEMQSEQLLLFQCVSHSCFSSVISLFFFFFFSFFLLSFSDQNKYSATGRKLAGFNDPEAVIFLLSSLMESIFFYCFLSLQVDRVFKKKREGERIQQALSLPPLTDLFQKVCRFTRTLLGHPHFGSMLNWSQTLMKEVEFHSRLIFE